MPGDIVAQGVELMLYGMGTVVVFLTLLILATTAMSQLVERFFPEPELPAAAPLPAASPAVLGVHDPKLLAIITAALHQHRKQQQ